jgi:alpha-tubulin suppressor-like RCC1 family protein
MVVRLAVVVVVVSALGCGSHSPYECTGSDQCIDRGVQGTCESQGYCSFPDPACPSGERFEPNAGDGLAGMCVGVVVHPDAAICGSIGEACCAGDAPCGDNAFCSGGTCTQCVTDVALGLLHSCFLKYDGTVWCSGRNEAGQLGNGQTSSVPTSIPVQVVTATGPLTNVTAIGAGEGYGCAIRADKTVWCWGTNNLRGGGALGDGTATSRSIAAPVIRETDGAALSDIVEVHGSHCNTCARDAEGGLWCWGCNDSGQLGVGTITGHLAAVPVLAHASGPPFTGAGDHLTVGGAHSCVRTTTEDVWCWGGNLNGQIGNNSTMNQPVPVQILTGASSVAAGRYHTCAVKPDHSVWCWGRGFQGRLGNGTGDRADGNTLNKTIPTPALTTSMGGSAFGGADEVAAGAMSCAVMSNRQAYCWGIDPYGQTGTGGGTYVPQPVLDASGQALQSVQRLVAQYTRACAFLGDGSLRCWGRNSEGELGDGTFLNHGLATPMKLSCP